MTTHHLTASHSTLHCHPQGLSLERNGTPLLLLQHLAIETSAQSLPAIHIQSAQSTADVLHLVFATRQPDIRITLHARSTPDGFVLEWNVPAPASALVLSFALQPDHLWYGMGERVTQTWPLNAAQASVISAPFIPTDHGPDGTLNLCTPLWFCSTGVALLVDEDTGELSVTLNQHSNHLFQLTQRAAARPPAAEPAPLRLVLRILVDQHLPATYQRAVQHLGHPTSAPPMDLFVSPIWTTWARYKTHITQAQVLHFADEITTHAYPHSVMEIDDRWQVAYGALDFDPAKFPDPRAMVDALHAHNFRVTLWVPPFFDIHSDAFQSAASQGYLLRDVTTGNPALTRWWQGTAGLLDVFNPTALDWWLAGLHRLQTLYGIDGFKFDGGESNFVPPEACGVGHIIATDYPDRYVAFVARHFQWTEVRTGWRAQRHGLLFREWDKWSRWGRDNGLHAVLTQALTLSILGYPFVLPDMIGGNAYRDEIPDAELMIRWTQLTSLLPAMQFSLAPWDYGDAATSICRRYAHLHTELRLALETAITEACTHGTPIVRPLFWHTPDDMVTYTIDDQFFLGAQLLVAPVLHPGQRQRRIYLPAGHWYDYWTGTEYQGPQWLENYPSPLETLPLFQREAHNADNPSLHIRIST